MKSYRVVDCDNCFIALKTIRSVKKMCKNSLMIIFKQDNRVEGMWFDDISKVDPARSVINKYLEMKKNGRDNANTRKREARKKRIAL